MPMPEPMPEPRCLAQRTGPVPADWRAALAVRLAHKPRRLGAWAELALWGARGCLDAAGLEALPARARLQVMSLSGPAEALRAGVAALASSLPAPYTFLQSQPLVGLAAMARWLHGGDWRGDALVVNARDEALLTTLARAAAQRTPVLQGRVELGATLRSDWWLWVA